MNFCNSYHFLEDQSDVTMVIVPPSVVERIELHVIQLIFRYDGKPMRVGVGYDNSRLYEVIFRDNTKKEMFCKEVNKKIEESLPFKMSSTMEKGGKEVLDVKISLNQAFERYQELMEEIQPAIQFIEENGGWMDKKTGKFPGMEALKKALQEGNLPNKKKEAIIALANFMAINIIGKQLLNTEDAEMHCGDTTIAKK